MCNGYHRALILVQVLFQPVDALRVKVVGRFIEQQHIRLLQQEAAQCHAAAFTSRQVFSLPVSWRQAQCVHGTFQTAVEVPRIGGVKNILQLALTGKQSIHLVFILVVLGQTKLLVNLLILGQGVHHILHTFLYNFLHRLVIVKMGVLRQIANRIARREYHLAW